LEYAKSNLLNDRISNYTCLFSIFLFAHLYIQHSADRYILINQCVAVGKKPSSIIIIIIIILIQMKKHTVKE